MDVLAVFAGLKLGGDRVVQEVQNSGLEVINNKLTALWDGESIRKKSRKRRRRGKYSRKALTDAELEAELELRRARRAREKDAYKKGLDKKKLNELEGELSKLRTELSSISDKGPSVRFANKTNVMGTPKKGGPPPPPPPPPSAGPKKPTETYAERRARELKGKAKKPKPKRQATLLDCLREAGGNPQARLKKMGTITVQTEPEENETASNDKPASDTATEPESKPAAEPESKTPKKAKVSEPAPEANDTKPSTDATTESTVGSESAPETKEDGTSGEVQQAQKEETPMDKVVQELDEKLETKPAENPIPASLQDALSGINAILTPGNDKKTEDGQLGA